MILGFRIYSNDRWAISPEDPTVWIKFCNEDFRFIDVFFPKGDPLYPNNGSYQMVLQSILDDYNNIPTSWIRLARYPSDTTSPEAPGPGDSAFTLERAHQRTIDVCFYDGSKEDNVAGSSELKTEGGQITGCKITMSSDHQKNSLMFIRTLTHELGHCFGLDHSQETVHSLMSYFSAALIIRLQPDDQMGMTYLYPREGAEGDEIPTFGLSCNPH